VSTATVAEGGRSTELIRHRADYPEDEQHLLDATDLNEEDR